MPLKSNKTGAKSLEARSGFEPLNKGFADLSLAPTKLLESTISSRDVENCPVLVRSAIDLVRKYAASSGYVYLIEAPELSRVKIGMSAKDPGVRIRDIQTSSPCELILIGIVAGGWLLESRLHHLFADLRVRGEWFRVTAEMRLFMAAVAQIGVAQMEALLDLPAATTRRREPSPATPTITLLKACDWLQMGPLFFAPWTTEGMVNVEKMQADLHRFINPPVPAPGVHA